jgi:hypothetical protein
VAKGVTDPARVSVGGHSYGAFKAANLVAHCPQLFAAAIARSGECGWLICGFRQHSPREVLLSLCIPAASQGMWLHACVCVHTCLHAVRSPFLPTCLHADIPAFRLLPLQAPTTAR